MFTVRKYPIIGPYAEIEMPKGAKILHVHAQRGNPCIWALVEPDRKPEKRRFYSYGTGMEIDANVWLGTPDYTALTCEFTEHNDSKKDLHYVGTSHFDGMVFHVFESK